MRDARKLLASVKFDAWAGESGAKKGKEKYSREQMKTRTIGEGDEGDDEEREMRDQLLGES